MYILSGVNVIFTKGIAQVHRTCESAALGFSGKSLVFLLSHN